MKEQENTKQSFVDKTFYLPVDLIEELAIEAQKKNISMEQLVIGLCKYGLKNSDDIGKLNGLNSI